jgi:tetratricopeptide (TPR) repeat protein
MSYPGDPALASDVKQRILTTFQQTLDLASKGNRQEALLGCDFILRLDPQFGPARTLQQLVQAGRSGPQLAELLGPAPAPPATDWQPPPALSSAGDEPIFGDLALDLPPDFADDPGFPAAPANERLEDRLARLLAERRFGDLISVADQDKRAVAADARLRQIVEQAHARIEAGPYVKTFVDSARQAMQTGEKEEAERLIRKARTLDPEHPDLLALDEAQKFYNDPSRAMGGRRRGIAMDEEPEPAPPVIETGTDLELPEVDFSFGSMAQDDYSLGDAEAPQIGAGNGSTGEHSGRIEELLVTGQAACDRGEFQAAIDSWSRIFLIDIDHQEAARRIEKARQLKAEREREIEEIFHEGVARFDSGAFEIAESAFNRVLELSPGYLVAQEYLDRIRERQMGAPPSTGSASGPVSVLSRTGEMPLPAAEGRAGLRGPRASGEILVPPEPGSERSRASDERPDFAVAVKRSAAPARGFLWIGGAVLLLLLAGGWLLLSNRAKLFPNSQDPVQAQAPVEVDLIARAKALHADGKTAIAIAQLRRLPPQEPQYAEAQSLISQWEALSRPAEPVPAGLSPDLQAKRQELVENAERACREHEFLRCDRWLAQAAAIEPLEPALVQIKAQAQQELAPLAEEIKLYSDGEFDFLLNRLWRKREAEPANRDIRRLIVDSYYNLGVLDLQRGDPPAAADKFREAVALDSTDEGLKRLQAFAAVYSQRNEDLLFEIFTRHLEIR